MGNGITTPNYALTEEEINTVFNATESAFHSSFRSLDSVKSRGDPTSSDSKNLEDAALHQIIETKYKLKTGAFTKLVEDHELEHHINKANASGEGLHPDGISSENCDSHVIEPRISTVELRGAFKTSGCGDTFTD